MLNKEFSNKISTGRKLRLRTGAWYGDNFIELDIPSNWELEIRNLKTPPAFSSREIVETLQSPTGQEPITSLCRGKSRPLIIVDDLTRPTPAEPVISILLEWFKDANISPKDVTILMASGAHGKPTLDALLRKVGKRAATSCNLLIHDCFDTIRIGKTSFGTEICANSVIQKSDIVIGVGGVYPNGFAGFGGGTKLALGTLGIQSIYNLHSHHGGISRCSLKDSTFRKEIDEVSEMIGLRTIISLLTDSNREIVYATSGDPIKYYSLIRDFAYRMFSTPCNSDSNVIISNTYPVDISLTFAHDKGFAPFDHCQLGASKIAIASCDEGVGLHNIFPILHCQKKYSPRLSNSRKLIRRVKEEGLLHFSQTFLKYAKQRISSKTNSSLKEKQSSNKPIWLYQSKQTEEKLPQKIGQINCSSDWLRILQLIDAEQGDLERLKVTVFPCAPLQAFS